MSLFSQAIELLSQAPGSYIYHMIVLFAIEVTLAMALRYRQRPGARRIAWAAAGMLVSRLALMGVALLEMRGIITEPAAIVPPLERAVDALGTWLLIWALLPLFDHRPQWGGLLSSAVVVLLIALYLFYAVGWYTEVMTAEAPPAFYGTSQETTWEIIQLILLATAGGYTLLTRREDWCLNLGLFALLLAAHLVNFGWAAPDATVAGWVRLGQLAAYPLLVMSVYRNVLDALPDQVMVLGPGRPPALEVEQIRQVGALSAAQDEAAIAAAATTAAATLASADLVGLALLAGSENVELELVSLFRDGRPVSLRKRRVVSMDEAPALRQAINQKQSALLRPGGADDASRLSLMLQLAPDLSLSMRLKSALYLQPVAKENNLFGVLLVGYTSPADAGVESWPAVNRSMHTLLASQLGNALAQARTQRQMQARIAQLGQQLAAVDTGAQERLDQAQSDLAEARRIGQDLAQQLEAARQDAARSQRRAQDLAVLLEEQAGHSAEVGALAEMNQVQQAAIEKLQQQLDRATVALAWEKERGAAGTADEGLATQPAGYERKREQIGQLAQDLRQPIASAAGYTDLLLGESMGSVGELQRLFLQRVKASVERALALLDDLVKTAATNGEPLQLTLEPVDVAQAIQSVVKEFDVQIAEKGLDFQVEVDGTLPMMDVDRSGLDQIIYHLFSNALYVTPANGKVGVEARYQPGELEALDLNGRAKGYLFVSVTDSGTGIPLADQSHVFDRHYRTQHDQIAGLGDADMGLPMVNDLVQAHGGRIWVESELNVGSTFSLVLPVTEAAGEG